MRFTAYAEREMDADDRYSRAMTLGNERRSHQTVLVFPGFRRLETSIRFTEATIGRNTIMFYSRPKGQSRRVKTGQVEADRSIVEFLMDAVDHPEACYDVVDDR